MSTPEEDTLPEADAEGSEEFEAINAGNEPLPGPDREGTSDREDEGRGSRTDREDPEPDDHEEEDDEGDALSGGPTGIGGTALERKAAEELVRELESQGSDSQVQEVRVPAPESATLAVHSLIVVGASLLSLKWPAIGAAVCLIAIFSFYSERGLGIRLIGRLIPGRKSRNVISPPPGPAWEDVDVIFATGYDLPDSYPVGEWLSRRFSGKLTTDRILFYGGMIGTFAALMLRVVEIEDTALSVFQTVVTAIPLAVIAAQIDRYLAGTPIATQEDLAPARDVMTATREAADRSDGDSGVAICLFGSEYASAGGATGFFADQRITLKPECTLINLVPGARGSGPEITASEGDLMPTRMSPELASDSPLDPGQVALRSLTSATVARRRGLRATTVVGRGETGVDLMLDAAEGALPDEEENS